MGNGGARVGLIAALVALWAGPLAAACRADRVELRTGASVVQFTVELADTPQERAQGLMFRESMPKSAGMLFVYERPQAASFWMKNTRIPLDMIFADPTGLVTHVHANAVPGDETPIPGGGNVLAVLEINGGLAAPLGIAAGAVLRHPALDQAAAAWPCDGG